MGGGIGMGNTCKPLAVSFQCMTKSTTNKKKINKKKKKKRKQKTDGRIVPDLEQRKLYAKSHTEKNSEEKTVHFLQKD